MYRYDEFDAKIVNQRTEQFAKQVARRLSGELSEEEFRPLRLMNGLYLQLHAYMFRIAIPYGTLSSTQMHTLADIAKKYDKDYGHFTTRQNIQFNWIKLKDCVEAMKMLASVEMHAIQTSGNCIRNTTSDPWAGVAADEHDDPRPYCEFIRQWSTFHPEFSFLPRKFKIAVTGADEDRAAIRVHDIGIQIVRQNGELGFAIYIGGGQGRTPMIAPLFKSFISQDKLLTYLTAAVRVYNQYGRRDNKYKARIKILVHEVGVEKLSAQIDEAYEQILAQTDQAQYALEEKEIKRIETYFKPPTYETFSESELSDIEKDIAQKREDKNNPDFASWLDHNTNAHKVKGYKIVNISLKPIGGIPGDATSLQMHAMADLAEQYSKSELRITHRQNVVLPYVKQSDLHALWLKLVELNLASSNHELASDIIACPGLDYCSLATARSIPIAQQISELLAQDKYEAVAGKLHLNISGCINACGHHHVGNIGILGLNKNGEEFYQITLGGSNGLDTAIGERTGPGFSEQEIAPAIKTIIDKYIDLRLENETFSDTYKRVGMAPFKEVLYVA